MNAVQIAIQRLAAQQDLTVAEMSAAMQTIMAGEATPAQLGAFLLGLHMKGETISEIATATKVLRDLATPVYITGAHQVDIVGTGGDQARTFNISTTSAFVAAAAGAKVAKHNNRAISSSSGSADLLEIAGIDPTLTPEQVAACIEQVGIGFMFAPRHHPAWQQVSAPRRELGIRTIFNILGPLVNPAKVPNQVIGVFATKWVVPLAIALQELGSKHVLIVHAMDGLDEISIAAPTQIAELKDNKVVTYAIEPQQFGLTLSSIDSLRVHNAQESFTLMQRVLANQPGPALDIVILNAGAAIYAADMTPTLAAGVEKAREVIASGVAREKLEALRKFVRKLNE